MAKLLPPIVENTTPAFYDKDGMVYITIPFFMNRAVNISSVNKMAVKIKTVQSNVSLYETQTTEFSIEGSSGQVTIKLSKITQSAEPIVNLLKVGQFYKFQIAYVQGETVGYYSNATTSKYTTKPTLFISELDVNTISPRGYYYTGIYSQEGKDITEALHSYRLRAYDNYKQLVYDTDWQLYNNEDIEKLYVSSIGFDFNIQLEENVIYFIEYSVKTINGLEATSYSYQIIERPTLDPEIKASLSMSLDAENGCIKIDLIADKDSQGVEYLATGSYVLTRACLDTDSIVWNKLVTVNFINENPTRTLFTDFTVEQGKKYQYGLQQFNCRNLYSNRILALSNGENYIQADFEHAFLYDGERQLKIKYNPKVSSFKEHILETKVDTLGGQYPFVFKNGNVDYKEFHISGLISLLSDENSYFLPSPLYEYVRPGTPAAAAIDFREPMEKPTFPTSDNFYNERNFKLEVLHWLTDGKPKLFRSGSEGNYIVRLMNTSLTPNDQLGRMLHTFSTTAYEVATCNYNNLTKFGFLNIIDNYTTKVISWKTLSIDGNTPININLMEENEAFTIDCYDMCEGDRIQLTLKDGSEVPIVIGSTGRYRIDLEVPIKAIKVIRKYLPVTNEVECAKPGYITYSFFTITNSEFKLVKDISYSNVPATQIIGDLVRRKLNEDESLSYDYNVTMLEYLGFILRVPIEGTDKVKYVLNPKKELLTTYYLKGSRRPWRPLYLSFDGSFIEDYYTDPISSAKLVRPEVGILYRGVDKNKCQDDIRSNGNEPWDYDLTDKFLTNNYGYLDFHKTYYTTGINIGHVNYSEYKPSFKFQTYNKNNSGNMSKSEEIIDLSNQHYMNYPSINFNNMSFDFVEDLETFKELKSFNDISPNNGVILEIGYFARNVDYLIESKISKEGYEYALEQLHLYLTQGADAIDKHNGLDYNCDVYYWLLDNVNREYNDYCVKVYLELEKIYNKEKEELNNEA